jgi:hypothetical protein
MTVLTFDATKMRRVVEHSLTAPAQRNISYTENKPAAPSVILVHDEGVYLMSNGDPRDIVEGERSYIVHAKGLGPEDWDASRAAVGGDDFADTLPWADAIKAQIDAGAKTIRLKMTASKILLMEPKARRSNGNAPHS